jgi:SAM-dependent methyltransferase
MIQVNDFDETILNPDSEFARRIRSYFKRELVKHQLRDVTQRAQDRYNRQVSEVRRSVDQLRHLGLKRQFQEAKKLMKELYNGFGADYDKLVAHETAWIDTKLLGVLASSLEDSDKTVVDAGCATGIDLNALANLFPEKRFIGYDPSRTMIDLARRRAKRANNRNITLIEADHRNIENFLDPNSVDVIYFKYPMWEENFVQGYMQEISQSDESMNMLIQTRHNQSKRMLGKTGTLIFMANIPQSKQLCLELEPMITGFNSTGFIYFDGLSPDSTYNISSYRVDNSE